MGRRELRRGQQFGDLLHRLDVFKKRARWRRQLATSWVLLGLGIAAAGFAAYFARDAYFVLTHAFEADAAIVGFEPRTVTSAHGYSHTELFRKLSFRDADGATHEVVATELGRVGEKLGDHEPVLYFAGDPDDAEPKRDVWTMTQDASLAAVWCFVASGVAWLLARAWKRTILAQGREGQPGLAESRKTEPYWDFSRKE